MRDAPPLPLGNGCPSGDSSLGNYVMVWGEEEILDCISAGSYVPVALKPQWYGLHGQACIGKAE